MLKVAVSVFLLGAAPAAAPPDIGLFVDAASLEEGPAREALKQLATTWKDDYAALIVDLARLMRAPASADASARVRQRLVRFLEEQTGQRFGQDLARWRQWMWNRPYAPHPDYAAFKGALYARIDPRMGSFFGPGIRAHIRLDEVEWGGVSVNGIPPLGYPLHVPAPEARYLGEKDVVFGIALNGEMRAYPKRILAWHEMVKDTIAGRPLSGVYCTLCGSMILYDVTVNGVHHELGTSGFLYRSNKLMYDHATKSLWSTLGGIPVVGALAGKGIELKPLYVVTTTWKEWRKRHPQTLVLSLDTGHRRDYSEGAAYREYFATDRLMFTVPKLDSRLPNKAEVLALRFPAAPDETLAIAADFLRAKRVYHDRLGQQEFVVLTDASGANRVYEGSVRFETWDGESLAREPSGRTWNVAEDKLTGPDGRMLKRLPAHRAFWFGWYAAYPNTRLIR